MNFKAFHSVKNITNEKFIDRIKFEPCMKEEWVVLEKIHGSNFSIFTDGIDVKAARRGAFLSDDDLPKFYSADKIVERYKPYMLKMHNELCKQSNSVMILRGELFGGIYFNMPTKVKRVQKGVEYCPTHEFIVFDISLDGEYMEWDRIEELLVKYEFLFTKPLFRGSYKDSEKWSSDNKESDTTIPALFGLQKSSHRKNIREGHVLRPVKPAYIDAEFIILKDKSDHFREISRPKEILDGRGRSPSKPLQKVVLYLTPQRLDNLFSKLLPEEYEQFTTKKNLHKIANYLAKDALDDYQKEHELVCSQDELRAFIKALHSESIKVCLSIIDTLK